MKRYFELGVCVVSLFGIAAVLLQDWSILYEFSGIIGIAAVIFACFIFITVKKKHRFTGKPVQATIKQRKQYAAGLFMFGIPNLLAAALYFIFR
ncbi:MAG: DUF5316 family protein [Ectobacillus sp.]